MSLKWLPNALTVLRCILAFVVGWAILRAAHSANPGDWFGISLAAFLTGAVFDLFDGILARRWHAESDFGRLLDPIADKLLIGLPLIALTMFFWDKPPHGRIILWPALAIIGRDVAITLLRFSPRGGVRLQVSQLAKWKTVLEFFAVAIPIAALTTGSHMNSLTEHFPHNTLGDVWIYLLHVAAALSLYTGWQYVRAAFAKTSEEIK